MCVVGLLVGLLAMIGSLSPAAASERTDEPVFARVNGEVILMSTYNAAIVQAGRARFYHARPPEAQMESFRREVGDGLVDQRLLHQEALRRGIEPDPVRVEAELDRLVKHNETAANWDEDKDTLLPLLRKGLEERDRVRQLEERLRDVAPPTEAQLSAYYAEHPEAFTSPPRTRVSIILLKVDPSSASEVWDGRLREGRRIYDQLQQGMEFAEAARRYSDDDSAAKGGDMGYLHEGMLGAQAEAVVAKLAPGAVSEPAVLLEGIAIFRLEERVAANLNPISTVQGRLRELWLRERREQAVQDEKARLRARAQVYFPNPRYYQSGPHGATDPSRSGVHKGAAKP